MLGLNVVDKADPPVGNVMELETDKLASMIVETTLIRVDVGCISELVSVNLGNDDC